MITITIYDDGVRVVGHAMPHICSQVSLGIFTLINDLEYFGDRIDSYFTSENNVEGISWVKFDITKESIILRDGYETNMTMWFEKFYPNDVKEVLKNILKYDKKYCIFKSYMI